MFNTNNYSFLTRENVMEDAQSIGWVVEPCADPEFIAIRSYKSDTNEKMRLGSSGELYVAGEDGWMYQVGTIQDVYNAVQKEKR